ncbi:hypothetical protein SanaruYs_35950 [Chryseotalea sanaruensis]|uniref:Uncharacterized protein n=2 Tax=Chryseotalea sanaruensis TaxID=2482724 RepID=A0A401UER0_9BACT|nr:hypothetical protein SanaruYs_35950 [Chryseotalea sanaruensis]
MTCPAYQSAYIHDKDALRKKFSYFVNDSAPKVYATSKSKFLIIEPTTYKKKERTIQTVEKKAVWVVVPDSLKEGYQKPEEAFSMAERNVDDSTAVVRIDTLASAEEYKISKDAEIRVLKYDNNKRQYWVDTLGYNNDQDNYMWYLRHVLVLPDARLAAMESKDQKKDEPKVKGKAKRERGGGLFKKSKSKGDSLEGYEGTTSATILPNKVKTKKVKKKKEKKPVEATPAPAKKEEDEDDGF